MEEIWLSPMTKAPTPTEKFKQQRDNKKAPKNSITQRNLTDGLRTASWSDNSHPTGVVKPLYERSPLTIKVAQSIVQGVP